MELKLEDIMKKYYKNTVKLFDKNYLDIVTKENVDEYLNKDILQIDNHIDILAVYIDKNGKENSLIINKNNFYNAYADKIWENLIITEKAQIIKWHYDFLCNRYNYSRVDFKFTIFKEKQGIYSFAVNGQMCPVYNNSNPKKNKVVIKLNPEILFKNNQYVIGTILEHEMQHLIQYYYEQHMYKLGADRINVKDVYELDRVNLGNKMKLTPGDNRKFDNSEYKFLLYKTSLNEKAADLTGLKHMNKIYKANQKLKLTNHKDTKKIRDLNFEILIDNHKLEFEKSGYEKKRKEEYEFYYNAEKNSDKIAELNSIGAILTGLGMTDTEIYKKLNDYVVDYMENLNWDEQFVKGIYQELFNLDLKDEDFNYGKALKNFYNNKYGKEDDLTK